MRWLERLRPAVPVDTLIRLSVTQPLTILASVAVLGVVADHWLPVGLVVWVGGITIAFLGWLITRRKIWRKEESQPSRRRSRRRYWDIVLMCVALVCLMAIRHHTYLAKYQSATVLDVISDIEEPTIAVGIVDQAVRVRRDPIDEATNWFERSSTAPMTDRASSYQTLITIKLDTLRRGSRDVMITGRVMIRVNGDLNELRPGDAIRAYGHISTMPLASNPGQRDQTSWAVRSDIHAVMKVGRIADIEFIAAQKMQWTPYRSLQRDVAEVASSARKVILDSVAPNQQGLALALILGQRDLLEQDSSESLIVTGTAHLLSVSGLHLGILFLVARWFAGMLRLPLGGQLVFLVFVTVFYVAITGGRPPVLRAAILLATLMLSIAMARPYHPLNSLSFALILLLWAMPMEAFSIGMQLSFLAVATLLSCGRPGRRGPTLANQTIQIEESFDRLANQSRSRVYRCARAFGSAMWIAVWYSGCVTMITLPLVWHEFHVVSPISVFVNVVLSPMMMIALSAGVATVLSAWIYTPFALVPAWVCTVTLASMKRVIDWASEVPYGHFWLPSPPLFWVVAYYVGLMLILAMRPREARRRPILVWSCGWIVIAWFSATAPAPLPDKTLEAVFIDVGHGTATILRPNSNEVWLYDCGWLGNFGNRSRKIDEVLWSMGVTQIDGVFLSHADADHFNALPSLARRFSISRIVTPPGMLEGDGRSLERTRQTIEHFGIPVFEVNAGRPIAGDLMEHSWLDRQPEESWWNDVEVLHPPREPVAGSDNANSLVLQINRGTRSLLLPGDLEPPGTSVLTSKPRPKPGGVIMAPHHGSLRMDADAVLQWARPIETVVSGGKRAAKVEVTRMLAATGGGVHVTSKVGCVRVRIDESGKVEVRSWKRTPW